CIVLHRSGNSECILEPFDDRGALPTRDQRRAADDARPRIDRTCAANADAVDLAVILRERREYCQDARECFLETLLGICGTLAASGDAAGVIDQPAGDLGSADIEPGDHRV